MSSENPSNTAELIRRLEEKIDRRFDEVEKKMQDEFRELKKILRGDAPSECLHACVTLKVGNVRGSGVIIKYSSYILLLTAGHVLRDLPKPKILISPVCSPKDQEFKGYEVEVVERDFFAEDSSTSDLFVLEGDPEAVSIVLRPAGSIETELANIAITPFVVQDNMFSWENAQTNKGLNVLAVGSGEQERDYYACRGNIVSTREENQSIKTTTATANCIATLWGLFYSPSSSSSVSASSPSTTVNDEEDEAAPWQVSRGFPNAKRVLCNSYSSHYGGGGVFTADGTMLLGVHVARFQLSGSARYTKMIPLRSMVQAFLTAKDTALSLLSVAKKDK